MFLRRPTPSSVLVAALRGAIFLANRTREGKPGGFYHGIISSRGVVTKGTGTGAMIDGNRTAPGTKLPSHAGEYGAFLDQRRMIP